MGGSPIGSSNNETSKKETSSKSSSYDGSPVYVIVFIVFVIGGLLVLFKDKIFKKKSNKISQSSKELTLGNSELSTSDDEFPAKESNQPPTLTPEEQDDINERMKVQDRFSN